MPVTLYLPSSFQHRSSGTASRHFAIAHAFGFGFPSVIQHDERTDHTVPSRYSLPLLAFPLSRFLYTKLQST